MQVRTGHWEHRNVSLWPGGLFGPLHCVLLLCIYLFIYFLPSECAKVIISDYGIRVAFYCGQPKAHLCNNHAVWSVSWYATPVRWMDYLGKGEVLTNTDLDRFVNNIWEK